jgi:hypothetical protein
MWRFKGLSYETILDMGIDQFLGYVPWDLMKQAEKAGGIPFQSFEQAAAFIDSMEGNG